MGAWNYGVFDDDTAYDALIDLKGSSDIIADMEQYFDEVIQAEYIGYDEAHYALVSAAVIDSVINSLGVMRKIILSGQVHKNVLTFLPSNKKQ